jgi:hypothetical protein
VSNNNESIGDEMKGIVRWPLWPAPAARRKSRAATRLQGIKTKQPPVNPANGITLALLEEHPLAPESAKGYDPYNAGAARRPVDAWLRKPKRD